MPRKPTPGLRDRILKAAEARFSRKGYHAVSVREIAKAARTSMSNLYTNFGTKEGIFRELLAACEREYFGPDQPLMKAFRDFRLPESIEKIGLASGEAVRRFSDYIRLMYVDVVEFGGRNIARIFREMRQRYEAALGPHLRELQKKGVLGPVDPVVAMMALTWAFLDYFTIEHVFGVRGHFGMSDEAAVRELSKLFTSGLLNGHGRGK